MPGYVPTQRGLGDTKDVTMDEAGTPVAASEVRECLFGSWQLFGGPGGAQGRPREAQGVQKRPKGIEK